MSLFILVVETLICYHPYSSLQILSTFEFFLMILLTWNRWSFLDLIFQIDTGVCILWLEFKLLSAHVIDLVRNPASFRLKLIMCAHMSSLPFLHMATFSYTGWSRQNEIIKKYLAYTVLVVYTGVLRINHYLTIRATVKKLRKSWILTSLGYRRKILATKANALIIRKQGRRL